MFTGFRFTSLVTLGLALIPMTTQSTERVSVHTTFRKLFQTGNALRTADCLVTFFALFNLVKQHNDNTQDGQAISMFSKSRSSNIFFLRPNSNIVL